MTDLCKGRVAIVTGAARGIGRAYALELARQGAAVVVNDLGGARDGSGADPGPALAVAEEIRASGGRAVASTDDVADHEAAGRLVGTAVSEFGRLDIVINNAGILRDRMLVNMTASDWDDVVRVHLRGSFAVSQHAAAHWRTRAKADGPVDARLINTSSSSGLFGNPGQCNYAAAKAGIAGFTLTAALELERYGVTVNCVYPAAASRLTAGLSAYAGREADPLRDPATIAPLVVWLASPHSRGVTGRMFGVRGNAITVAEGWRPGPSIDRPERWDPGELGEALPALIERARPNAAPALDSVRTG
ncbi:SDR family oxidoreductase [Actinomadura madurae]|uniref:SDR family oxidoreductase n=1 Tax=Actinomadura madurae TaxID=1993 RepID=UPI002026242C|nr:SDR family oxidoreductase [Actinomadura madurae]URN00958.1 SDR family oxidoreductase [Actinomadura madurae]URN03109.1 SDR family oxidoreductase [Actinomadura madurae]